MSKRGSYNPKNHDEDTSGPAAGTSQSRTYKGWETRTPKNRPGRRLKVRDPFSETLKSIRPIYEEKYRHIYEPPIEVIRDKEGKLPPPDNFEDIDLRELYSPRTKYTPEEKIFAVTAFVVTGTVIDAHKLTGIPKSVIASWKNNALWWTDAVREVKNRKQEELEGKFTEIIHAVTGVLAERVVTGNPKYNTKTNEIDWVPLDTRELLFTLGVVFEKRALIRGDPTSRHERVSSDQHLEILQKKMLEAYTKLQKAEKQAAIDVEVIKENNNYAKENAPKVIEVSHEKGINGREKEGLRPRDDEKDLTKEEILKKIEESRIRRENRKLG